MSSNLRVHSHGTGPLHVHATVDHLASDQSSSLAIFVQLDRQLMTSLGAEEGDILRLMTDRGTALLVRLQMAFSSEGDAGYIRLDRFTRQALKTHLNDTVEIELTEEKPVESILLRPSVDVSMAHDLLPHLKQKLIDARSPVTTGGILYITFPKSAAGITYEARVLKGPPGIVTEATEVNLDYHDSHLPDGVFDISYQDIGGLDKQILEIRELVQLPLKFPHVYRQLGICAPRGIILYGPPGSGKTHLARAVANEVDARFFYINGPDVVGTYSGETEGNLRRMFAEASHHAPSIIFIDELDSIAPKRGETGAHSDTRTVTQLLSLMDGLTRVDSVIVIATTNRVDTVDAALRRPGRFDRELFIGPPDTPGRLAILGIHTREMPLSDHCSKSLHEIARRTHGFLGADLMELCRTAGLNALRRGNPTLSDHHSAFKLDVNDLRIEDEDFISALSVTRPSALRETLITIPDVGWNQIGGLSQEKLRLQEAVEIPLRNARLLSEMGLPPHSGVLLYGPPGTGKTLLAKAVAHECGVNFVAVNGSELFTKWLGESEEAVRHIFRIARQVSPCIVFFDQLEALAPIRGNHDGAMTTQRVVGQLLAEMDGLAELSRVVVIGATNRRDLVDPAVLRAGRMGTHIEIRLPDATARLEIFRLGLGRFTCELTQTILNLVEQTLGWSGAELRELCDTAKRAALKRSNFEQAVCPTDEDMLQAHISLTFNRRITTT